MDLGSCVHGIGRRTHDVNGTRTVGERTAVGSATEDDHRWVDDAVLVGAPRHMELVDEEGVDHHLDLAVGNDPTDQRVLVGVTDAFVLSGGASLGAAQVGMLLALADAGIEPDLIIGTSVGAVNGGWLASRPDRDGIDGLAELWQGLRREDIFPTRPLLGLLGFLGKRRNFVPNGPFRRLVSSNLEFEQLEDAPIPLHVVTTDVLSGADVLHSTGSAVDAIVASAAIPAVFPPVTIDGRDQIDGGVVNNTPISHACALGADTVWVLSTGYACALDESPMGALAMALHALSLTVNQRLAVDVARFESVVDLRVVPPLCPIRTSPADFSQSAELIERAHEATADWLTSDPLLVGQAELLQPH